MSEKQENKLAKLVAELDEDAVLALVRKRLDAGEDPLQIINECNFGMQEVGQRYEEGEYFVAGLIMSGEIFREVVELAQPLVVEQQATDKMPGRVLVGTVAGDIHDIGKNIFGMLLTCHGFDVVDLGVDVPPDLFAEKATELQPDIIGLSGLITSSFEMMKETVSILRTEFQKNETDIPIIIGGSMIDKQIKEYVGADYWMSDAMGGVRLCEELMNGTGFSN